VCNGTRAVGGRLPNAPDGAGARPKEVPLANDAYDGYLTILARAGRLPGLVAEGFEPMALDAAVHAIVTDRAFNEGEDPPAVDTYDRMRAFQAIAGNPSLRSELGDEILLSDLLATGMAPEYQAVLRVNPLHDASLLTGDEVPPIDDEGLDVGDAETWRGTADNPSVGEIGDALDAFSSYLEHLDGTGLYPPSEDIANQAGTLLVPASFHGCDIQAIASTIRCRDDKVVVDSGPPATRITTSFLTDNTLPDQFLFVSDPENWPKCDKFFKSMTDMGTIRYQLWNRPKDFGGKEGHYLETVDFGVSGLSLEMNTYLRTVTFRRPQFQQGLTTVGMTYNFAGSLDGHIDVDHGYLLAQRDPRIEGGLTRVSSQKTVRFRKLTNALASLACELGWAKQMRRMGCCNQV
jgi:hypothetical protein